MWSVHLGCILHECGRLRLTFKRIEWPSASCLFDTQHQDLEVTGERSKKIMVSIAVNFHTTSLSLVFYGPIWKSSRALCLTIEPRRLQLGANFEAILANSFIPAPLG